MFGNTTPRNYIVTIRHWPDAKKPTSETHEVPVCAYDLVEATIMANMRFAASIGGIVDNGGKSEAVDVRPAQATTAADLLALLTSANKERK